MMTMPIQSEDISRQFSINAAAPMEKHQNFDQSTEELNKRRDVEKKKRPEDAVSPLAAIAAQAWARQPIETNMFAKVKSGLNLQSGSMPKNSYAQPTDQSDSVGSTAARKLNLRSPLIDAYKSSTTQISLINAGANSVDVNSISGSAPNANRPEFSSQSFSSSQQSDNIQSTRAPRDLSPPPLVAPAQSASSSRLAETQWDVSPKGESMSVSATQSKINSARPSAESQMQIELDGDTAAEQPSSLAQRVVGANEGTGTANSSDLFPKRARHEQEDESIIAAMGFTNQGQAPASPYVEVPPPAQQQFSGDSAKRSVDQANAALSIQKAVAPEGIRYSLESWGADKSVQITGTAQKGYVLHASDNEVRQILEKHEDESLSAIIAAGSGVSDSNPDQLKIEAVGLAEKSEA